MNRDAQNAWLAQNATGYCERYAIRMNDAKCAEYRELKPIACKGCDGLKNRGINMAAVWVDTEKDEITSWLPAARKAAGLTQAQLAEKIGVHKTSVACWELGRYRPTPEKVAILELILGKVEFDSDKQPESVETVDIEIPEAAETEEDAVNTKFELGLEDEAASDFSEKLTLEFTARDQAVFRLIETAAQAERRTIEDQILYFLEHNFKFNEGARA